MPRLSQDVRPAFRLFAFYLGNGTLAMDVLEGIDYRPAQYRVEPPFDDWEFELP